MKIEQIYTGCLSQGAYYIESDGEAVVIDPLREVKPYIEKAARSGTKIKYILETHFHADFVSGHLDLARETGATIVYGPGASPNFQAHIAADGEMINIGQIHFTVLHTPGHTMESTCYLLSNEVGKPVALFSGDTLFIGDVGRPDLAQKLKPELTPEVLAGHLFDSLRNKIMHLSDDIIVYPAHGAGSACGKMMSHETSDSLGNQKKTNYALRGDLTREAFVKAVLNGLTPPPQYFSANVLMNIKGYDSVSNVIERGVRRLPVNDFEAVANSTGAPVLDTREASNFARGFIPGSINIGIDGSFAPWVGSLIPDVKQTLLLVTDEGKEEEVVTRLSRVGYDGAIGCLAGGFEAWKASGRKVDTVRNIAPKDLSTVMAAKDCLIIDVRKESEYNAEHIADAINAPLDYINDSMLKVNKYRTTFIYCAGGYRSMIFASILKARGYDKLVDVTGGFKALKESGRFKIKAGSETPTQLR